MSGDGDIPGLPEQPEIGKTTEQPAEDLLSTGARDLAYTPGDNVAPLVAGSPEMAVDIGKLANLIDNWSRTSKLFDGAANAQALNNCRDSLDPQFVAVLQWNEENPEEVKRFLTSMQGALG